MAKQHKVHGKPTDASYASFAQKARYHDKEYLIEVNGTVLVAGTPRELYEKYVAALSRSN